MVLFSAQSTSPRLAFHDLETGKTEPLTFGDRDEHAPWFVDGGWQLAFVASHAFAPVYAGGPPTARGSIPIGKS